MSHPYPQSDYLLLMYSGEGSVKNPPLAYHPTWNPAPPKLVEGDGVEESAWIATLCWLGVVILGIVAVLR